MAKKERKSLPIAKKSNSPKSYKSVFGLIKESTLILSANSKNLYKNTFNLCRGLYCFGFGV